MVHIESTYSAIGEDPVNDVRDMRNLVTVFRSGIAYGPNKKSSSADSPARGVGAMKSLRPEKVATLAPADLSLRARRAGRRSQWTEPQSRVGTFTRLSLGFHSAFTRLSLTRPPSRSMHSLEAQAQRFSAGPGLLGGPPSLHVRHRLLG